MNNPIINQLNYVHSRQYFKPRWVDDQSILTLVFWIVLLNFIWVAISTLVSAVYGTQALLSATRMLVSTCIALIFYRYIDLNRLMNGIYYFAIFNSIFVVLQILNLLVYDDLLPRWLHYGQFFGLGDAAYVDPWRQGGIVPSLQTSSLLGLLGIVIGSVRGNRILYFLAFPLFWSSIFFGARTIFLMMPFALIFVLYKKNYLVFIWIYVVYQIAALSIGFDEYFELRFGSVLSALSSGDFAADYSAADTLNSYRLPDTVSEFIFGNSCNRYTACGGGDPLYTRWLFQAGVPSLILVTLLMLCLTLYSFKYSFLAGCLGLAMMAHSVKGELVTSTFVYDLYLIAVFALRNATIAITECNISNSSLVSLAGLEREPSLINREK
jgi:hypothetical protein